jgi:hypothetical protein
MFRYDGFGISAQAVTVTPREQLLVRGGVALVVWTILGLVLAGVLWMIGRPGSTAESASAQADKQRVGGGSRAGGVVASGLVLAIAVLVLLLMFLRVWWPLFALMASMVVLVAIRWEAGIARRFLVCALAVGMVAIAYEAGRLTFVVERTCVQVSKPQGRTCGILIGQTDRGMYLGKIMRRGHESALVFIPARRVRSARTTKLATTVTPNAADTRRKQLLSRVIGALP